MLEVSINDADRIVEICKALATPLRVEILRALSLHGELNIQELAELVDAPASTVSINVKAMEDAGLIISDKQPAKNGSNKVCSPVYLDLLINLRVHNSPKNVTQRYEQSIPIGNFHAFEATPSCGYVFFDDDGNFKNDFQLDNKYAFLLPERMKAQLLWFRTGYVEYLIPVNQLQEHDISSLSFSMEICSEAPGHNDKWKSDITMWINDIEVGTWESPADFGGRKGKLTPMEWDLEGTQFGILTEWVVNENGSYINNQKLSGVTIDALDISNKPVLKMRIGVKEDAEHLGGLNLFGERFGNYPQNIVMSVLYIDR